MLLSALLWESDDATFRLSRLVKKSSETVFLFFVVVGLLTLAAYWPALQGGFIWDDDAYVTGNQLLHDLQGLKRIWFELGATQQYYPMVFTTFWLEYHFWHLDPANYHVVNVLLHIAGALLLWRVLVCLEVPGAWLAGAIFALHPVQVESVAWVTERKNVLSAMFYFASALAYLRFVEASEAQAEGKLCNPGRGANATRVVSGADGPWGRRTAYLTALVFFAAALLSKTVTCSLPAALLLIRWWKKGKLRWLDVRPLVPFFAMGAGLGLLTSYIERYSLGAQGPDWSQTFFERCLIAGRVVWFYAGKLVYPAKLSFIYPRWSIDGGQLWQWLFPIMAVAVVAGLWLARRRLGRGPLTAVLFFGGTLFPALGFLNVYPMRFSFVADHFQYLASAGLITLGAACLYRFLGASSAIVLLVLGTLTWNQTLIYKNRETLWQDTLMKNPGCWLAYNNLGVEFFERGQMDEAIPCYTNALAIRPTYADAHVNLGNILILRGQLDEAIMHYRKALEPNATIAPSAKYNNADYRYSLGAALLRKGQVDEAAELLRKALELWPDFDEARFNLGEALLRKGQVAEALSCYQKVLETHPDDPRFRYSHAHALLESGDLAAGKAELLAVLSIRQVNGINSNTELLSEIAAVSWRQGNVKEACDFSRQVMQIYRQALEQKPDIPEALNNLAWILATSPSAELRDGPEAVRLAERACELTHYESPIFAGTLAAAYAEAGRFDDAVAAGQKAQKMAQVAGQKALEEKNAKLVELYRSKHPYRDSGV